MSQRENILIAYKRLLTLAKLLPKEKQLETKTMIRHEFSSNKDVHDNAQIEKLLQKALSSLSYLKIVTPRQPKSQTGQTKIVFGAEDGKTTSKAYSNWTGGNLDPDSVARHNKLLNRAGFRDNAHAKGIF